MNSSNLGSNPTPSMSFSLLEAAQPKSAKIEAKSPCWICFTIRAASSGLFKRPRNTVIASQMAVVGKRRELCIAASCSMIPLARVWFSSPTYTKEINASASTIISGSFFFPGIFVVVGTQIFDVACDVVFLLPRQSSLTLLVRFSSALWGSFLSQFQPLQKARLPLAFRSDARYALSVLVFRL
jgi:hypothetical protein